MRLKLLLFLIILFFFASRLYEIGSFPPSLYWDEASIGYNAYSVLKTGRDEWGSFLPLHFRAFGEFKLPVYIYSVVAAYKMLGIVDQAVRVPAVIYSAGVVLLIYLILLKLLKNELIAVFGSLVATVSPWLIIISRTGFEATAGLFFFLLGFYIFLLSRQDKRFSIIGLIAFIAAMYSYNSFRILAPLVLLPMLYQLKSLKIWLITTALFLVSLVPIYRLYRYDFGGVRYTAVAIQGSVKQRITIFVENYKQHFGPSFLFSYGDQNLRHQLSGWGVLYWASLPFLVLGVVQVVRKRKLPYFWISYLFLIAPLPAAVTKEAPHTLRAILLLPTLVFLMAAGFELCLENFGRYKIAISVAVFLLFVFSFEFYAQDMFLNYNRIASQDWQYGYKQIFTDYRNEIKAASKVIISDRYAQPYIFALYYLKYDPILFRQTVAYNPINNWGFSTVASFDKFYFKKVEKQDLQKNVLVFATPEDNLPFIAASEIKFLDKTTAFLVYKL